MECNGYSRAFREFYKKIEQRSDDCLEQLDMTKRLAGVAVAASTHTQYKTVMRQFHSWILVMLGWSMLQCAVQKLDHSDGSPTAAGILRSRES
jgi:hypothetical protein